MQKRLLSLIVAPLTAFAFAACEVEQTQEGESPEVEIREGQMPEYEVDTYDLDITRDTQQVVVPDIELTPPSDTLRRDTLPR
jgi:hypothetical protein